MKSTGVNLQKFPHCPIMRRDEAIEWIGSRSIIEQAGLEPITVGRSVYFRTSAVRDLAQRIADTGEFNPSPAGRVSSGTPAATQ